MPAAKTKPWDSVCDNHSRGTRVRGARHRTQNRPNLRSGREPDDLHKRRLASANAGVCICLEDSMPALALGVTDAIVQM